MAAERASLLAEEEERGRHLRELALMKADFTAMVAHELAFPLCAVRGYAEMLAADGLCRVERERLLDRLRAETDGLDALVSDVRALATVERDDFSINPCRVPVHTLLEEAASFAGTLPGGHPLTVVDGVRGAVWVDAGRIGQVLRNLLKNAAAYSPEGAPVSLEASPGGDPDRVCFSVYDHGPGIHPDDVGRIFEKYDRGRDAEGRKVAGAGLGLYLSRRIIHSHGSELIVRSEQGSGSTFAFDLEKASTDDRDLHRADHVSLKKDA